MGRTSKKAADLAPPYTPTERERLSIERVKERRACSAPAPRFNVGTPTANVVKVSADHPDAATCHILLADAFGTGRP